MNRNDTLTGKPAALVKEFLAINDLNVTEEVLFKISIHALDEEVDPPKLTPSQQAHLLRLIHLVTAFKVTH